MKKTTLCFPLTDTQVLLALKKEGFGTGKINGFGGKVKDHESVREAAARELKEESDLSASADDLEQAAIVNFFFEETPICECHVFFARSWTGKAKETQEMAPQWHPIQEVPFEKMWAADAQWFPLILQGEKIEVTVIYNSDGSAVKELSHKPAAF